MEVDLGSVHTVEVVVFALAVCALAIVLFSLLIVIGSGLLLRHRLRRAAPPRVTAPTVEAGYPNETGYSLPAMAWLPLISLDWKVVSPDFIETRKRLNPYTRQWEESVVPLRRCRSSSSDRRRGLRRASLRWTIRPLQPKGQNRCASC